MSTTTTAPQPTKVTIGPVRLSYAWLNEPRPGKEGKPGKYESSIIISKNDTKSINACKKAIAAAKEVGKSSLWKGKLPAGLKESWYDGDTKDDGDVAYANSFYFTARKKERPPIVDKNRQPILEADQIYSGIYAYVCINFFAYDNEGKGIGAGLQSIMKIKDGEPLGAHSNPEMDFAEVDTDADESFLD